MANKYRGSIVSTTAASISNILAPGMWRFSEHLQNVLNWPTVIPKPSTLEYLVVAGGGGATYAGGGAGGLLTGTVSIAGIASLVITLGAGGGGFVGDSATNGTNSILGDSLIISYGGGAGLNSNGNNGGSGGGNSVKTGAGGKGVYPGSTYISAPRQGYDGGTAQEGTVGYTAGAGGGGAGGPGLTGTSTNAGLAGSGLSSAITGSTTYYAGGGGAYSNWGSGNASAGGLGGGGSGNPVTQSGFTNGYAGTNNTGGGGGGSANLGGNGGSGIIIIRYADTFTEAISTTGSPIITVSGGYRVYKFTSSGSITF